MRLKSVKVSTVQLMKQQKVEKHNEREEGINQFASRTVELAQLASFFDCMRSSLERNKNCLLRLPVALHSLSLYSTCSAYETETDIAFDWLRENFGSL